jgi:hypothetical protein
MKKAFCLLIGLLLIQGIVFGQDAVSLANRFISLLNETQKTETVFAFDTEERYNFHFVPKERRGITFNEMNSEQQKTAYDLLKSCLGDDAFHKTKDIMQLENVLKVLEKRKPEDKWRDPGNYHFTIFGMPSSKTIWGWRFEGHHISFNFSFNKKTLVAGTPGFLGSNPAIVLSGPMAGKQVLKKESDAGFALLNSLSNAQIKKALIDTAAFPDILTLNKRNAMLGTPVGIRYSELSGEQQCLMLQLINTYIHRYKYDLAEKMIQELRKEGLEDIWFAWAGHTKPVIGKGAYYRIHGPTILIEYDNTQNNANHVHSVVRDLKHDFGGDLLLEHYKKGHSHK